MGKSCFTALPGNVSVTKQPFDRPITPAPPTTTSRTGDDRWAVIEQPRLDAASLSLSSLSRPLESAASAASAAAIIAVVAATCRSIKRGSCVFKTKNAAEKTWRCCKLL
jgi:hypothetical protein